VPAAVSTRNAITLSAISACVTDGAADIVLAVRTLVRSREHSGHRIPTGVGVEHAPAERARTHAVEHRNRFI